MIRSSPDRGGIIVVIALIPSKAVSLVFSVDIRRVGRAHMLDISPGATVCRDEMTCEEGGGVLMTTVTATR